MSRPETSTVQKVSRLWNCYNRLTVIKGLRSLWSPMKSTWQPIQSGQSIFVTDSSIRLTHDLECLSLSPQRDTPQCYALDPYHTGDRYRGCFGYRYGDARRCHYRLCLQQHLQTGNQHADPPPGS